MRVDHMLPAKHPVISDFLRGKLNPNIQNNEVSDL